ncbi:hypothetical protein C7377_0122 [Balneicella halophila]|uniref:Uncharacterized protein n=1 Tax=Balneicella halophila TaxID=1537566 RepID=A0A7L4UQP1_BALHA|nr:hypothetical protein [Balneicella halophila]PVX51832.1 hypothetical protein C7377_0122 [Balneicella halophila]
MLKYYFTKNKSLWGLFLPIILIGLYSCTDDDFVKDFNYVSIPINSVDIPDTIFLDQKTTFTAHSLIKQGCQVYLTMDYVTFGKQIISTAKAIEHEDQDCGELTDLTLNIDFTPNNIGSYTFLFWAGENPTTEVDKYITKEIFVKAKNTQAVE